MEKSSQEELVHALEEELIFWREFAVWWEQEHQTRVHERIVQTIEFTEQKLNTARGLSGKLRAVPGF